ncbi:tetratricopeptide repeat protein [Thermodesulfovibrio yellowstonii]|uniref:O-linked GlcNAc transferase n=1 Tax=Thermodesulfovibrio yellowstonii TaxID=28262 RepID=A0A9W6GG91_9BACT|nr:tetratricopeptide repeat protein [Thermodesulfovibrio islandicus]GLI53398.1 O-linked GlcNAc transferase [Thermodesulfovibrio islandicus]
MENKINFEEKLEEANLLLRYREFGEACKIYDELLNENYQSPELYNNYGLALFYLDKFDEALEKFQKAIEVDTAFALAYANTGLVYLNKGEYEKAEQFFLQALERDPENPETHYNIAVTYYRLNKKNDALKHYEAFIDFSGDDYGKLKESVQKIIAQIKSIQKEEGSQV